jgi:hypothetical protein
MDELFKIFIKGVHEQGFVALMLVIAIIYLQKRLDKLDAKIMECEQDRKNLWERLLTTTINNEHH